MRKANLFDTILVTCRTSLGLIFISGLTDINILVILFFLVDVHNQLHFRSTASGFKTYSPSLPTITLLDGLLG